MTQALDFSSRAVRPLDFSARARPTGPITPSPYGDGSMAAPRQRGLGERFTDVVTDAARRNPLIAVTRAVTDARPVWEAGAPMFSGGLLPRWEDKPLQVRDPGTGEALTYRSTGQQMRDMERERRDSYQIQAEVDGWQDARGGLLGRVAAGATNVTGALVGAMADPLNLIAPGKTVVGRIVGGAGVNAAGDAVTQGADIGADLQENYSPVQTLAAGALGGLIQGGFEAAPRVAQAATSAVRSGLDFSSRAVASLPNPVPDFSGRAMETGPVPRATTPRAPGLLSPPPRPAVAVPERIAPALEGAAASFGVSRDYLANLARRESAFDPAAQAPTSSATGLYQFINETWLNTLRQHGRALGLPNIAERIERDPASVLAMRTDPDLSSRAAALLTRDNARSMQSALGRAPTDAELYTAHFLGPRNAQRMASADAGANAAEMFPAAARANRSIFYEGRGSARRPRTVAEVRARLAEGFDQGPASVSAAAPVDPARGLLSPPPEMAPPVRLQDADLGINEARLAPSIPRSETFDRVLADIGQTLQHPAENRGGGPVATVSRESLRTPDGAPVSPARQQEVSGQVSGLRAREQAGLDFSSRAVPDKLSVDLSGYGDRIGQTVQSSGRTVGGLRDAPRPGAVPRENAPAFEGKTVSQLADDLRSALGLTQRQGRVSMRRAAGEYDTGSGVIRTRAVDEMDVISHEAFHAFEYERTGPALAAVLKSNAADLKKLAYPGAPANVARQEGFAEFGRWYLTNPDHARRIAPQFFDAFEAALKQDSPDVLAKMQAIQAGYRNVLSSASIDVAKGSIAYTGSRGPIRNLVDDVRRNGPGSVIRRLSDTAYTWFIDDLHPLSVATRTLRAIYAENTGQKLDLKRAADPYALARLSREAYAAGHNDLMNGVTPYRGLDPEGPSLADALEKAGLDKGPTGTFKNDALRTFDAYLIARRMVHEWDRYAAGDLPNPPDRNTKQFHEQVIADAEAAHPTFAEAAGLTYQWLENLWRKEFEAGLITKASYENGLTAHPDYVPLMRDMSDKGPGKAGKPRGAMQFAGGVKQFEGSSRDIISPLSSMMRRSYELGAIIKRNDTLKALDDLAQAAGRGAGAIVERLPAKEIQAYQVNAADALQKTADELGLSGRDLSTIQKLTDDATDQDAMITLFKQSEFSPRKGEAVVFVWRDGQKTPLLLPDGEFGQAMFQALAGMNKDLSNVVVDSMAAATQLLRYGVTLSPEFMAANLVRDALATWINTDVGFIPGVDTIRGGAAEVAQGQLAKRYANAGGMRGGANVAATSKPFPKTDAEADAQLQHLRRKGWKVKRYASWRGLAELTDLSETATRMGVFKRGFDQAKRKGLSDYEAIIESGFTSRDYLDFSRRGSKMLTASRIVTFLNAALQGLDKSARVLSAGGNLQRVLMPLTKEARTPAEKAALGHAYKAWAKVSALGALGLGLRMLYADDPEYQEINDRLRATHWIFRTGGQWVFVPKPFELATISNILERGYEGTVLQDPTAGERLLSDFRHTIAPPSEIPALSIPFAIGANRDYLGRPIVPDHLRGTVDPQFQFSSYTSDLGKLIGKTFNVSPAVVDYVVTGLGGSLGRYVLQGSNIIGEAVTGRPRTAAGPEDMFLSRRFIRAISRGSTSQAEFWDQVSRDGGDLTRAEGSFRNLMRDGRDEEAVAYLNRLPALERGFVTLKVFGGEGESVIHPMVRAQKAVGVLSDFRSDVREGELRNDAGAVIPLPPQDRRNIDAALAEFAQAEMRNALIATGVKGWAQKPPMQGLQIAQRIHATNPEAYRQLQLRLQLEKAPTAIWPEMNGALDALWGQLRQPLSGTADPARFVPALRARRLENGDGAARYEEAQKVIGGGYAPAPATAQPLDFSARAR